MKRLALAILLLVSTSIAQAATNFAVVRAAVNTSTGSQDFTKSGFGTPTAAIFLWNTATADDTETAHNFLGIGFTDDTNEGAVACYAEDNISAPNVRREMTTTKAVQFRNMSDTDIGAADSVGATGGAITDGWRLDWTTAPTSAFLLTAILIKADNAHVGTASGFLTASATDVTAPGFQADVVVMSEHGAAVGASNFFRCSVGAAAHNGTSWSQAVSGYTRNETNEEFVGQMVRNDEVSIETTTAGNSTGRTHGLTVTATHASGFTAQATAANYSTDTVLYLALDVAETPTVITFDSPNSASSAWAVTGAGFTNAVEFAFGAANTVTAYNTGAFADDAGGWGLFAWTDDSEEFSLGMTSDDNAVPTRDKSHSSNNALLLRDFGGTTVYNFTNPVFDSEGWDIGASDITTASSTTHKWWALVVEAASGGGGGATIPIFMNHYRRRHQ